MKQLIFNHLKKFFKEQIDKENKRYLFSQNNIEDQKKRENKKQYKLQDLSTYIAKPVIVFNNDVPLIGFVKGITSITLANDPVLYMTDYISQEDFILFDNPYILTSVNFNLLKSPLQVIFSLLKDRKYEKVNANIFYDYEKIMDNLNKNNFFEHLNDYIKIIEKKDNNLLDNNDLDIIKDKDNLKVLIDRFLLLSAIEKNNKKSYPSVNKI